MSRAKCKTKAPTNMVGACMLEETQEIIAEEACESRLVCILIFEANR